MDFSFTYRADQPTTIKRLLAKNGVSHRLLAKLFQAQLISVDGRKMPANGPVAPGQKVTFTLLPNSVQPVSQKPVQVVFENANWLILNKPAHLASVPGPSSPVDSLLTRVTWYLKEAGITSPQPAIITRLDRDTTGLVLSAKHLFAQGRLDQIGVDAAVEKRYRALISGQLDPPQGTINLPLAKAADGIHRRVDPAGQPAVTVYQTIRRQNGYSLLELQLKTGRTHQIRAHLAHLGHPLVGDGLYGGAQDEAAVQQLQAYQLRFTDPFMNQLIEAKLPLPETMAHLLTAAQ